MVTKLECTNSYVYRAGFGYQCDEWLQPGWHSKRNDCMSLQPSSTLLLLSLSCCYWRFLQHLSACFGLGAYQVDDEARTRFIDHWEFRISSHLAEPMIQEQCTTISVSYIPLLNPSYLPPSFPSQPPEPSTKDTSSKLYPIHPGTSQLAIMKFYIRIPEPYPTPFQGLL